MPPGRLLGALLASRAIDDLLPLAAAGVFYSSPSSARSGRAARCVRTGLRRAPGPLRFPRRSRRGCRAPATAGGRRRSAPSRSSRGRTSASSSPLVEALGARSARPAPSASRRARCRRASGTAPSPANTPRTSDFAFATTKSTTSSSASRAGVEATRDRREVVGLRQRRRVAQLARPSHARATTMPLRGRAAVAHASCGRRGRSPGSRSCLRRSSGCARRDSAARRRSPR